MSSDRLILFVPGDRQSFHGRQKNSEVRQGRHGKFFALALAVDLDKGYS
jgi:hypothetical protein